MTMNSFQKNVLFIALIISVLGGGAFVVNYSVQQHNRQVEEQKVAWRKANLRAVRELSVIGALSTEEQVRVDNAGDDFERLQLALIDIHTERLNYWNTKLVDIHKGKQELQRLWASYSSDPYSGADYQYAQISEKVRDKAVEISEEEKKALENQAGFRTGLRELHAWTPITFKDYCAKQASDSNADSKK